MAVIRWLERYAANGDPRAALGNLIALLIVSNQPFYPLYIYWLVGNQAWAATVSFVSTPFFCAVPALARRNSLAGRALLCVTGTFNTALCVWALGEASAVGLFYLPCILISVLLFRKSEWPAMVLCTGLPMVAFWFFRHWHGAPLDYFDEEQYAALLTLHVVSVSSLIAFIGYKVSTSLMPE